MCRHFTEKIIYVEILIHVKLKNLGFLKLHKVVLNVVYNLKSLQGTSTESGEDLIFWNDLVEWLVEFASDVESDGGVEAFSGTPDVPVVVTLL